MNKTSSDPVRNKYKTIILYIENFSYFINFRAVNL